MEAPVSIKKVEIITSTYCLRHFKIDCPECILQHHHDFQFKGVDSNGPYWICRKDGCQAIVYGWRKLKISWTQARRKCWEASTSVEHNSPEPSIFMNNLFGNGSGLGVLHRKLHRHWIEGMLLDDGEYNLCSQCYEEESDQIEGMKMRKVPERLFGKA